MFLLRRKIQKFLLEHAALVEALAWRARHGSEVAFLRHVNFLSLMSEVTKNTARWLIAFLTGPHLSMHMWRCLCASSRISPSNCDSSSSINSKNYKDVDVVCQDFSRSLSQDRLTSSVNNGGSCGNGCLSTSIDSSAVAGMGAEKTSDFTFLNLSRFFRGDCDSKKSYCGNGACSGDDGVNRSFLAEKFVRELCELLESVDVKHTNL